MAEDVGKGRLSLTGRIEVKDESGSVAMFVSFKEALVIDDAV
jgi:hypothetical protein